MESCQQRLHYYGNNVDRIYPIELAIKDTTDTDTSVPYIPGNLLGGKVENETLP